MDIGLVLIKFGSSILVVLALSAVAERVSPRVAGIISGYPAGIAINLFFFGYEIGPVFAAESALYTAVGLLATQSFVYFYQDRPENPKALKPGDEWPLGAEPVAKRRRFSA